MQREYTCFTTTGKWNFYADNDIDAMRLALFYCWRDNEDFDRVESGNYANKHTIRICMIDKQNWIQTL